MTNREALEAFLRQQQLDQHTIRQLLGLGLITAEDITTLDTPPGQREYLPIALTLKGHRLLDNAPTKSTNNVKKNGKKKKTRLAGIKKIISGVEVKWIFGIAISVLGLFLTYKYTGAEDLRNKVYSPLNADLEKMQASVSANSMTNFFSGNVLSSLKQSGDFYRMPKSLQREVNALYDDEGQLEANIAPIVEVTEREVSRRVEALRSEQEDREWGPAATARIRSQEQQKPGISTLNSFTMTHAGRSRALDLHDPGHPVLSGPGGPEFQINDWLAYPASIENVSPLFGEDDYLYFDARDDWYFRITRSDLSKKNMTLKEFLDPIHDSMAKDAHFKSLQANQPEILQRLAALKTKIAERMGNPKRLSDLFD